MKVKRIVRSLIKGFVLTRNLVTGYIPGQLKIISATAAATVLSIGRILIPALLTLLVSLMIYDIGFDPFYSRQPLIFNAYRLIFLLLIVLYTVRYLLEFTIPLPRRTRIFNLVLVILIFYLADTVHDVRILEPGPGGQFALKKIILYTGILVLFATEVSHILRFIYRKGANPALLFVGSFALLIVIGGFLLMLPNATFDGIHPVDAFFTSVSAVCVTGLAVVDTATAFTTIGKIIILLLIQIGGLGIMTFAGMISFLVTGTVSFQNQLALRDLLSSDRLSNVISFVSRIVIVTICFELAGAVFIYASLSSNLFDNEAEKMFFSVFHAVSAFCNAGFSTLTNGLYEAPVRFNYGFHWVIAILIILGGIGFPVVFNIYTFFRIKISNLIKQLLGDPSREVFTNILSASSKLSLATTSTLLIIGFITYFIFEYNATLQGHTTLWGKITTSFFGSVTPRTAGFNTVDLTSMTLPTVMIYLLLMWIGASPGSTGGGIKTTVAAVAFLNMRSIILGRKRTEAYRSEVSEPSINRAFAIILLSLLILGAAVLLLSINDADKGLLKLAFEVFSAFSTVGLTLGITPQLSLPGKLVIMAVMFIGRVGALTLLFAVVTRAELRSYRYPSEDIMF